MSKTFNTEEGGKIVTNVIPDDLIDISGEGFGPMLIGFPNTKISIFRQQLSDPAVSEIERRIIATIQVPTLALLGLAQNVRAVLKNNSDQMRAARAQIDALIGDNSQPRRTEGGAVGKGRAAK